MANLANILYQIISISGNSGILSEPFNDPHVGFYAELSSACYMVKCRSYDQVCYTLNPLNKPSKINTKGNISTFVI